MNYRHGYCVAHYQRWAKTGDPGPAYIQPRLNAQASLDERIALHTEMNDVGCLVWTSGKTRPRAIVDGVRKAAAVHVWEQVNGLVPKGLMVLHACGNDLCVLLDHLYVGTSKQNADDMMRHGTRLLGEKMHSAKLTRDDVLAIRADKRGSTKIAAEYGISPPTVHDIWNRRTWAWLE